MMYSKNWTKFPVLFSLYIAQSIPMSFFSTVVPVIMRQESYSLQSIGLLQLIKLPWILKFLWAPTVDNHTRSPKMLRKWIISSEIFYAAVILTISLFSLKTDFTLIVMLMILAFLASGTQDIAVDIFAIKTLKRNERSIGNSIQSAGSFVGTIFGTGVLLIAYHYFGWSPLLWILAAFVMVALTPLFFYKAEIVTTEEPQKRVSLADIFRFFKIKGMGQWVLILTFYYSGLIGILTMLKPYLVDLGYGIKEIGFMSGILGTTVAAISAFSGGFIIKMIGRKASLIGFVTLSICAGVLFWLISSSTPGKTVIMCAISLLWACYGLSTVIIYTLSMDKVRKGSEGTDFTLQIVLTHLSSLIFAVISGKLADIIGYHYFFGVEVLLSVFTLTLVFTLRNKVTHGDR